MATHYLYLRLKMYLASLISFLSLNSLLILFWLDNWWNKIALLFSDVLIVSFRIWRQGRWSPRVVKLGQCSSCSYLKLLAMHVICLPLKKTSLTQINYGTCGIIVLGIHMLKNFPPCYNIAFIWIRNHGFCHQNYLVKIVLNSKAINYLFLVVLLHTTLLLNWFTMMYGVLHQFHLDWGINILFTSYGTHRCSFLETKVKFLKS